MKKVIYLICGLFLLATFGAPAQAESLSERLSGRILLQVEANGEAWYVNPKDNMKCFLGTPADAFRVMRELGLGISEGNYYSYGGYAPESLKGKILLRVENKGEAYYVNPVNRKMHYLGRPADAFNVMRNLGLGISNLNLDLIETNVKYALSYDYYVIEFDDAGAYPSTVTTKKGKTIELLFKAKDEGLSRGGIWFKASHHMGSINTVKTGESKRVSVMPNVSYSYTPFHDGTNLKLGYVIEIEVSE